MGLEAEAERLVRMGESRAEVSRRLGVHPQTLACWALRGGWRKKDLDLERSAEATRRTILAIRHGNAQVDRQNQLRGELEGVKREAVALLADGSVEALEKLSRMVGAAASVRRLEAPKVELSPDPKAVNLRSIGDCDENERGIHDENGVEWTPERLREHHRRGKYGGDRGFS